MAVAARLLSGLTGTLYGAMVLVACGAGVSCSNSRPNVAPAPAPIPAALDASYDWHVLVRVPFQTRLKESPEPLHEVLLFHEESSVTEADNKDCYAVDGTPPRFVGRPPENYLLCFDHDRLSRIEASVRLPAAEAPTILARACALWSKNSRTGIPADPTLEFVAPAGNVCEGHEQNVAYSARLSLATGEAAGTLIVTLLDVVPRT